MALFQFIVRLSPLLFISYFWRFKIAGIPFTFLEIFIYGLFFIWVYLAFKRNLKIQFDTNHRKYHLAAGLILMGATMGVLLAPETMPGPQGAIVESRQIALGIWKGWVVAPLMYFWVLTQTIKNKKEVDHLLKNLIYSGILVGFLSIIWALWSNGYTNDHRLKGFYESANYLSLYITPILGVSLAKLHQKWSWKKLGISTFLGVILFLTKSYAAILAVFGAVFFYLIYLLIQNPKHRTKIIRGLVSFGFLFTLVIVSQINTPKFKQFIDLEGRSSSTVRLELYQASWAFIKQHPFKGLGPGLFQAYYQDQVHPILGRFPLEWNMPHPHNLWLGFWFNAGLLGLIGFIYLILLAHRKFTYPLVGFWVILLHGLFDMPFWKNDLAMIFWVIIACILTLQFQESGLRSKESETNS